MEEAQTERATGTLTVRDGDSRACTLYFLFGHLFHALADDRSGDEAVVGALGWAAGEFDFDPKAKLPADETVRSTIPELINSTSGGPGAAPPGPGPAPTPEAAAPTPPVPQPPAAPEPVPPPPPAAEKEKKAPEPEPEEELPTPRRGVKHRPQPKHGREQIPVPAGQLIYDSLKTSFVDFPRLITTLEREAYTGYVRLLTDDASGLILFKEGVALECVYDIGIDPSPALGRQALQDFNDAVIRGTGVLDVVGLSPELVDGLYELTVARPLYTELYASWIDMDKLLEFLEKRKLSGSLMVRAAGGTGVIILTGGKLAGAYTSESRDIAETAQGVLDLCQDREAMIEVKAAEGSPTREKLDVDAVIGTRKPIASPAAPGADTLRAPEPAPVAQVLPIAAPVPAAPPPAPTGEPATMQFQTPPPPTAAPATPITATQPAWTPAVQSAPTAPLINSATPQTPLPVQGAQARTESLPAMPAIPVPDNVDWEAVIADLQSTTEEALGNRSRKVKDVLGGAEHSRTGLEAAIDQVPTISILFVDSSRLEALAADLRAKLQRHLS